MEIKKIGSYTMTVDLTVDDCMALAQACKVAGDNQIERVEQTRLLTPKRNYTAALGAAFQALGMIGLSQYCLPLRKNEELIEEMQGYGLSEMIAALPH